MISREDVAREANVSAMTVTRVVSGKGYVSEKTRIKVKEVIDRLGYIPNKLASNFAVGKNSVISVIVPDLSNPYYMEVVNYLISEAQSSGYTVSVYKASGENLISVLENLVSNRVAGVINFSSEFPKSHTDHLKNLGIKVIRGSYFNNDFKMEVLWKDAIYKAFDKMRGSGAQKVIFISGLSEEYFRVDSRVKHFLEYLKEKGLDITEDSVIKGDYPNVEPYIVGEQLAKTLVENGVEFDGAFCINDMMAMGVINGLRRKGLRIPEDVQIVGFDNIMMSAYVFPTLSTISIDAEKEARLYFNYIADVISDESNSLVAEFIERESTL